MTLRVNWTRISGPDRHPTGTFLVPKSAVIQVAAALRVHMPPVLITQTVKNDAGRVLGVVRTPMPVQQFLKMMAS